jgi:hypothetical protein
MSYWLSEGISKMRKTDESRRNLVTASIKRHSMHIETWKRTQLWTHWSEPIKAFIAKTVNLAPSELGIIGYLEEDSYGYLITTQRVVIFEHDQVRSIMIDDIENYEFGLGFKGYRGRPTETFTLRCKGGQTHEFRFEAGLPSMGAIYGIMTLLAIGKTWGD